MKFLPLGTKNKSGGFQSLQIFHPPRKYCNLPPRSECIYRFFDNNTQYCPESADDKLSENDSEEKGNRFTIRLYPAILQDKPFDEPRHNELRPKRTH